MEAGKYLVILGRCKQQESNGGFTLIELLVVIIIMGLLAAIALPAFIRQAVKAREAEAKTIIGAMNRAQQAYFLEENEYVDTADFRRLGLGINQQTNNYSYMVTRTSPVAATNQAQPQNTLARAYIGGTGLGATFVGGDATTLTIVCEGVIPPGVGGPTGLETASFTNNYPSCPAGLYQTLD